MQYKYVTEPPDYSDLASGRVFYSLPGHPAFPVRLASEIFQRCLAFRTTIYQDPTPCTLYDPCCGAAYHLSVLAYLHREHLQEVIASDIDEKAVALASQNLGLLGAAGLDQRIRDLSKLFELYQKSSHQEALSSAAILSSRISAFSQETPLITRVFQASAADRQAILENVKAKSVDMVFTDIPYGQHSHWRGVDSSEPSGPLGLMLDTLQDVLSPSSIVAVVSDKQQKVSHPGFQRLEQFQIGKRRAVILRPV